MAKETKEEKQLPAVIEKAINEAQVDRKQDYETYHKNIQQSLYYFTDTNPFIGGLLQEMNFKPEYRLPTAALAYDKQKQTFEVLINPDFFDKMTLTERIAVLHHEILHFTNKHCFRFSMEKMSQEDKSRNNQAADVSINQYIQGLPKGCLDVKYFQTDDGKPFPLFATAEVYAELIKDNPDAMKNAVKNMKADGIPMDDKGNGEGILDEHNWEELSDEEKKQMAEEMKKMIKRTMEKTSYSKSSLPDSIKDLIEEIDSFLRKMNYKQILQSAIKRTVSFTDRANTWKRPNKRYGVVAQGSTLSKLPQLNVYIDTSGSISVKEMNEFLAILNGFLKAGTRKCQLGFWHTSLYKKRTYKVNSKIKDNEIESGGTDMTQVCEDINKTTPDLAIILTDGYYDTRVKPKGETIIIISDKGGMDHPLKTHKTVKTLNMTGLRK